MRVRRLDHFGVDVADLARAERFYTEVLGMSVVRRLPDQVLLSHDDGNCALFFKPDRAPGGLEQIAQPLGKSHHAFEVSWDDYRAAPALFASRDVPHHASDRLGRPRVPLLPRPRRQSARADRVPLALTTGRPPRAA